MILGPLGHWAAARHARMSIFSDPKIPPCQIPNPVRKYRRFSQGAPLTLAEAFNRPVFAGWNFLAIIKQRMRFFLIRCFLFVQEGDYGYAGVTGVFVAVPVVVPMTITTVNVSPK